MKRGISFGGDYNPEQWGPETWAEDAALMAEARVNTATVGVFSWSALEPEPGVYDFGWLDEAMERLHAGGVRVVLATPTASPPPWFSFEHPDALPVTPEGTRLWHGSRDTYCVAAPAYRQNSLRIAEALAERYGRHPALAMWHVHNEYGTLCWCDHVAAAFRRWLQARYGTGAEGLQSLNVAWNSAFWSQRYSRWEHIVPPRATQYLPNPSQMLDFRRFFSDELLAAYREQRDLLHRYTPDIPITTNFMLPGYQMLDFWSWGAAVDQVAVDIYPEQAGAAGAAEFAFGADRARSFNRGRPWLLMEQAATLTLQAGKALASPPGTTLRQSISALAHGSEAIMYFQWRPGAGGAETHHASMVPHTGADSRTFREIRELGEILTRLDEITGSTVHAEVALLWDADAWWASDQRGFPSDRMGFHPALAQAHRALWELGLVCDVAHPGDDLSRYKAVFAPSLYLLGQNAAANLAGYVTGGGQLLVGPFSAVAGPTNLVYRGGYPGAGLRDVLGIRVSEWHPLPDGATLALSDGSIAELWTEDLQTLDAEVLATYTEGVLAGQPALTRRTVGQGRAEYLSARLDDASLKVLLRGFLDDADLSPGHLDLSAGVEVLRRHHADGRSWLFVIDHGGAGVTMKAQGFDLISGLPVDGALTLPPGGVAVLREP